MSDQKAAGNLRQVFALGFTQTVVWASSTYLPAILAQPIASELELSRSSVFGAFSVSLVVMALSGPAVGRAIDRNGGRGVLALSNLVLAAGLLLAAGASAVAALTASALLGPAQVAARLFEFMAARRFGFHPLQSARLATAMHPLGGLVLGVFGGLPLAASSFAVLHGAGNGMITIAKGTLPLAIFGPAGYGCRQGLLSVLARAMQALAPFAFGLVLDIQGARAAIVLSSGLSLVALGALMALRQESAAIRTTPRCSSIGGAARFPFTSMGPTSLDYWSRVR